MNGSDFVETVRDERATQLHRLGSDKYLIAATGADLSTDLVLRSVAASAANAGDAFAHWASTASDDAAETFESAAATERDHYDRVVDSLDDEAAGDAVETEVGADDSAERDSDADDADADDGDSDDVDSDDGGPEAVVSREMQSVDGTVSRTGAMLGRGLVADRTRLQVVNFFVNEGDRDRAALARDLRSDANDQVTAAADLLEAVCASDEDWADAYDAATAVVTAAYEEYADALEGMGVDPKPVC